MNAGRFLRDRFEGRAAEEARSAFGRDGKDFLFELAAPNKPGMLGNADPDRQELPPAGKVASLRQRGSGQALAVKVEALREATTGRWRATVDQKKGPGARPFRQSFEISLRACDTGIVGDFTDSFTDRGQVIKWPFSVTGDYYNMQQYLQLDCRPRNLAILQFSVWVLEIDTNAETLNGQFVGYGAFTKAIISGIITLTKLDTQETKQ